MSSDLTVDTNFRITFCVYMMMSLIVLYRVRKWLELNIKSYVRRGEHN